MTRIKDPIRQPVAAFLLLALLAQTACMTAPRGVGAPAPFLQSQTPKRIWVSLANGEQIVIDAPKVYGDSLLGFTQRGDAREEVWMPLSDLRDVKARHLSGSRTALMGGLIAIGVGLTIILIPVAGGEREELCTYDCDDGQ